MGSGTCLRGLAEHCHALCTKNPQLGPHVSGSRSVPCIGDLRLARQGNLLPHSLGGTLSIHGCGSPGSCTLRWHRAPSVAVTEPRRHICCFPGRTRGRWRVAETPPNIELTRGSSQTGWSAWGRGRESSPGGRTGRTGLSLQSVPGVRRAVGKARRQGRFRAAAYLPIPEN